MRRPDGKIPLGRPRNRWDRNIKGDLGAVGWGGMDWIAVARIGTGDGIVVNAVMNRRVPENAGNFLIS